MQYVITPDTEQEPPSFIWEGIGNTEVTDQSSLEKVIGTTLLPKWKF